LELPAELTSHLKSFQGRRKGTSTDFGYSNISYLRYIRIELDRQAS
jgi:hypothetical protein